MEYLQFPLAGVVLCVCWGGRAVLYKSLESYSFGVGAIPAGSRGMFVLRGALDFGQLV